MKYLTLAALVFGVVVAAQAQHKPTPKHPMVMPSHHTQTHVIHHKPVRHKRRHHVTIIKRKTVAVPHHKIVHHKPKHKGK